MGVPEIFYSPQARRHLKRLDRALVDRIRAKLRQAAHDPGSLGKNIERLSGRSGYRLRVGDWRIIFDRDVDRNIIVHAVLPRDTVYKRL